MSSLGLYNSVATSASFIHFISVGSENKLKWGVVYNAISNSWAVLTRLMPSQLPVVMQFLYHVLNHREKKYFLENILKQLFRIKMFVSPFVRQDLHQALGVSYDERSTLSGQSSSLCPTSTHQLTVTCCTPGTSVCHCRKTGCTVLLPL